MTLNEYLLGSLAQYGLPVIGAVILVASMGAPLPATLLLLTAGMFVAQGHLSLWAVIGVATCAAVLGDHLGYGAGRWGSQRLVARLKRWGGPERIVHAEQIARRWGGTAVFLSRWLFTPVGPVLNLASGWARYPWLRFAGFDLVGELVWVTLYVTLGRLWGTYTDVLGTALGSVGWGLVAVVGAVLLGRFVLRQRHAAAA